MSNVFSRNKINFNILNQEISHETLFISFNIRKYIDNKGISSKKNFFFFSSLSNKVFLDNALFKIFKQLDTFQKNLNFFDLFQNFKYKKTKTYQDLHLTSYEKTLKLSLHDFFHFFETIMPKWELNNYKLYDSFRVIFFCYLNCFFFNEFYSNFAKTEASFFTQKFYSLKNKNKYIYFSRFGNKKLFLDTKPLSFLAQNFILRDLNFHILKTKSLQSTFNFSLKKETNFFNLIVNKKSFSFLKNYIEFVIKRFFWLVKIDVINFKDSDLIKNSNLNFLKVSQRQYLKRFVQKRAILPETFPSSNFLKFFKKPKKFKFLTFESNKSCKILIRYTGSNLFITMAIFPEGKTITTYSGGLIQGLIKRRDRYSIFTIRKLGQLIALRLYQSNLKTISFNPRLDSGRVFKMVRYLFDGFKLVNKFPIQSICVYRPVIRNGIRNKKLPRK